MKKFFSAVVALCLVFVMSFSFTASAAADKIVWDDWDIDDVIVYSYLGTDTEITIPNMDQYRVKLTTVGTKFSSGKAGITKIVVANGITTLDGACFEHMPDLEEVVFPSSLTSLGYGYNIFDCPKIEKVTIPGSLPVISNGFAAMAKNLKEVVFSYGIQNIGFQSFRQTALTNVVIPETVEQIESWAFTELLSDEFTITICNPDVKLTGGSIDGQARSEDVFDQNPNVKITIICPEGSTTEKYYTENPLPNAQSKLVTKPQSYFDALPENQSDYGQQEVAAHYAPEGMEDVVHDGTKKFEEAPAVSSSEAILEGEEGNNNNNNNSTVTVGSSIAWMPIITVIIFVFAAIILVLIIVVVIFVIVHTQKKKKRKVARAERLASKAANAAVSADEVAEPVEAPLDEPETQE